MSSVCSASFRSPAIHSLVPMANGHILITGVTGHIGYRTLVEALRDGYKVRAAVRRESSIVQIRNITSIQPFLEKDQLTFICVEDITNDDAFDTAMDGMDYAIHIASPLPKDTTNIELDIVQPAVRGTLSILKSALKHAESSASLLQHPRRQ